MEDRLRKFAALKDAGSFTKAATELRISQPALSAAIRQLEQELDAALIVHGVRPLAMTPAGEAAYKTAKELATSSENLRLKLAELKNADIHLRIGMLDSVAGIVLGDGVTLEPLEQRVRLSITVNNSRSLMQAVERGELDVAFVVEPAYLPPATLHLQHLADEPLVLVCAPDQANAFRQAMSRGTLPHFISYDQASATSHLIHEALHRHGITPSAEVYSTSPEVMLRLALLKRGVAILPYHQVAWYVARDELTLIGRDTPGVISRGISLARRRDKELTTTLNRLVRQIRRALNTPVDLPD